MELCRSLGIDFVSVTEAVDTSLPAGELVFHMIGAVAQFERSLIGERVKSGLANARAKVGSSEDLHYESCRVQKAASSGKSGCNATYHSGSWQRSSVCRSGLLTACVQGVVDVTDGMIRRVIKGIRGKET